MDIKDRFKLIPAIHLLLLDHERVLFGLRQNTGYEDGKFHLIAGHADGNETLTQAMTREALEEIGIIIKPDDLNFVHVMHRLSSGHERVDFFFECKKWRGTPEIKEPEKCSELKWFSLQNLPKDMIPYTSYVFGQIARENFYSEYGW